MIRRKMFDLLLAHLSKKEHSILIGARQIGKTTLLKQLETHLKEQGEAVYFLSFEDMSILRSINEHPENLFRYLPKPSSGQKVYVLIDEIQYANNPSNFLKYLYDLYQGQVKLVATGSSAFYLDKKFSDSLAGRKQIFELYTLDFEEFILFQNKNNLLKEYQLIKENPLYISNKVHEFQQLLEEYMLWGGYPAVVLSQTPQEKLSTLNELTNSFLKKDIFELGIKDENRFYDLLTLLAGQIGGQLNQNELSSTLRIQYAAVEDYIAALCKSFHISLIKPFFGNQRKELTKMPKLYFNDLGLRNMLLQNFSPTSLRMDKGELLENYAFTVLRGKYGNDQVHYWRTADGNEVDFVVREIFGNAKYAYEVKWSEKAFKKEKYKKFTEAYPDYPLSCLSFDFENPASWVLKI